MDDVREDGRWRLRPAITAGVGLIAALMIHHLLDRDWTGGRMPPPPGALEVAFAALIATGAIAFVFTAERLRLAWAIIFAATVGLLAGLVVWWNGGPGVESLWDWRSASLIVAIGIAAPLFQTARDEGAARFPYVEVHGHAWTNIMLWFLGWGFAAVVWLLAWLLGSLFELIGIKLVIRMLQEEWFAVALIGAAAGGGVGLLRERDRIVRTLQRVGTAILSVLAPVLGVGLILFLLALPFTGLSALWDATKATTPILLTCVAGAFVLANAVIGDGDDREPINPAIRWSAMALGVTMLPLAVIAAIATGLRIDQYGLSPDRLWALVFVACACAFGLSYIVSLVRGRGGWAPVVRQANLRLAFGLAAVALVLATPLVSFNALATRDQVARLEGSKVAPDNFDWAALAFDFGEPGKAALKRLGTSANAQIAKLAAEAIAAESRSVLELKRSEEARLKAVTIAVGGRPIRVLPAQTRLPDDLRRAVFGDFGCDPKKLAQCVVFWKPNESVAIAMRDECATLPVTERTDPKRSCSINIEPYTLTAGRWIRGADRNNQVRSSEGKMSPSEEKASLLAERAAIDRGAIEIRPVTRRQVFVGDKPVGDPFE